MLKLNQVAFSAYKTNDINHMVIVSLLAVK